MNFSIIQDHPDLLKYVLALQAKNSDALGFLPRRVFEQAVDANRLFLGLLNGEPCGYILAGSGFQGAMRCVQVAIQYDVRRRLYGAMLVSAVEGRGELLGCTSNILRCGSELEANAFWQGLGYVLTGTEESGEARKHRRTHLNVWRKTLAPEWIATSWKNGRPRIYSVGLEKERARDRQRACRERNSIRRPFCDINRTHV